MLALALLLAVPGWPQIDSTVMAVGLRYAPFTGLGDRMGVWSSMMALALLERLPCPPWWWA